MARPSDPPPPVETPPDGADAARTIWLGETAAYSLTFGLLVAFVLVSGFTDEVERDSPLLILMFIGALTFSLGALVGRRRALVVGGLLGVVPLGLGMVWRLSDHAGVALALLLSLSLYFGYVGIAILVRISRGASVDVHALAGVVAAYMLSGFAFATLYLTASVLFPDVPTFDPASPPGGGLWEDAVFFSFATLTTVGWGDVSASAPFARAIATLEAVFGVMFMAIVVARFASSFWSDRQSAPVDPGGD